MIPKVFVENQAAFASTNDATAQMDPGTLAWNWNSTYESWQLLKYVQLNGAVAATVGSVSNLTDVTAYGGNVTCDRNNDELVATSFGGVFLGSVTADYFGWVCVGGIALAESDDAVAVGDFLVPHTVDNECDTMADGEEEQVFGIAFTAASTASPNVIAQIWPRW